MPSAIEGMQMGQAIPGRMSAMGQALHNLAEMGFKMGEQQRDQQNKLGQISAAGDQQRQTQQQGADIKKQEAKDEYDLTMDFLRKMNNDHPDSPVQEQALDFAKKTLEMRRNAPGMPAGQDPHSFGAMPEIPSRGGFDYGTPGGEALPGSGAFGGQSRSAVQPMPGDMEMQPNPNMESQQAPPEATTQPSVPLGFGGGDIASRLPEGMTVKVGNATITGKKQAMQSILAGISAHPEDYSDEMLAGLSSTQEGYKALIGYRNNAETRKSNALKAKTEAEGKPLEERTTNMAFQDAFLEARNAGKTKDEARKIAAKAGKENTELLARIGAGRYDLVNRQYLEKRIEELQEKVEIESATDEDKAELEQLTNAKRSFAAPTPEGTVTSESIRNDFRAGKISREEALKKLRANGLK